jgi:DNA-3-methyladenine glycosylase
MAGMKKLPSGFYLREDVVSIAKELLGKVLVSNWDGEKTTGRIVETEAYAGERDQASHAFKGLTKRTGVMYGAGGVAYVYLCYGIHQMFNIVTGAQGTPHAVLIRGVEPMEGVDVMLRRTGKKVPDETLTRGPGNVGRAFGFHTAQCGLSLTGDELYIGDDGVRIDDDKIVAAPRIGVAYAGEHALWDYRFYVKGNRYVSGKVS